MNQAKVSTSALGFSERLALLFTKGLRGEEAKRRARVEAFTSGPEPTDSTAMTTYRHARCSLELWRVTNGRLDTAERTVAQLREWTEANPHDGTTRPCADAIQALYSSQIDAPDAEAAAMQLDSVLLHTFVDQGWNEYYALVSGRVWQRLGDGLHLDHHRAGDGAGVRVGRKVDEGRQRQRRDRVEGDVAPQLHPDLAADASLLPLVKDDERPAVARGRE